MYFNPHHVIQIVPKMQNIHDLCDRFIFKFRKSDFID